MAETRYLYESGKTAGFAKIFNRTSGVPLDRTQLFDSLTDAQNYAKGDNTDFRKLGSTRYVGQLLTVYQPATDGSEEILKVYFVNSNNGLTEVGKGTDLSEIQSTIKGIKDDIATIPDTYVPKTLKINNKALNADITLSAADVGALSTTGTAAKAEALSLTQAVGNTKIPVYFNAEGIPVALNYTIETSVPANAVFTDEKVNVSEWTSAGRKFITGATLNGNTSLDYNSSVYIEQSNNGTTIVAPSFTGALKGTAETLDWEPVTNEITINFGFSIGSSSEIDTNLLESEIVTLLDKNKYNTVFMSPTKESENAGYFIVQFSEANSKYQIVSIKSNGFNIPTGITTNGLISVNQLPKDSIIENLEVVIKTL